MSLMKIRQRIKGNAAESWQGREFRAPPSAGRIVLHSIVAIILGGFSLRALLSGQESAAAGVLAAAVFALLAHVNWQRLKEARNEGLLPRRILCPSCEAPISLNSEERRVGRFSCASCGEDFEITDQIAPYKNPSFNVIYNQLFCDNHDHQNLMAVSRPVVDQIGPLEQARLAPPSDGIVRMTFLVSDGLYFSQGPHNQMGVDSMAGPIIAAGLDLMQAIVGITQEQEARERAAEP